MCHYSLCLVRSKVPENLLRFVNSGRCNSGHYILVSKIFKELNKKIKCEALLSTMPLKNDVMSHRCLTSGIPKITAGLVFNGRGQAYDKL